MTRTYHLTAIVSCLLFCASPFAQAASLCSAEFNESKRPESAVEIEISGAAVIDVLFTTKTGTLRPVAGAVGKRAIPLPLYERLAQKYPGKDPLDAPWGALNKDEKLAVLGQSAWANEQYFNFYDNRTVQGLVYRDEITLTFRSASRFMGRQYPPGTHRFKSLDIFGNTAIEFSGPNAIKRGPVNFEIHLRRADGPAENLESARTIQRALTGRIENVHQHVVTPIPIEALRDNPEYEAYKMTEFFRRISMYAQALRIEKNFDIVDVPDPALGLRMSTMGTREVTKFYLYFKDLGQRLRKVFPPDQPIDLTAVREKAKGEQDYESNLFIKSGLMGVRAGRYYDGPLMNWGLEFRDLAPTHDHQLLKTFLDITQQRMLQHDYGIPDKVLRPLFDSHGPSLDHFEENLYPSALIIYRGIDKERAAALGVPEVVNYQFMDNENKAILLLFHHWEKDPVLAAYPHFREQLLEARRLALKMLAHGTNDREVMRYFVKKSGLKYILELSLGLRGEP